MKESIQYIPAEKQTCVLPSQMFHSSAFPAYKANWDEEPLLHFVIVRAFSFHFAFYSFVQISRLKS